MKQWHRRDGGAPETTFINSNIQYTVIQNSFPVGKYKSCIDKRVVMPHIYNSTDQLKIHVKENHHN